MDLIEKAAKRLEQLRRAGLDLPETPTASAALDVLATAKVQTPPLVPQSSASSVPAGTKVAPEIASSAPVSSKSRFIQLDMVGLATRGVITPDAGRSFLADEMRGIKRPLLNNVAGKSATPIKDANLIMVTSAVPAEGKTHIAANLAMSIAMELDHTVLLVDADVARPSLPALLGIGREKGLLDLLTDSSLDPSDVLLRTNIDKLTILPAGTQHPRATELLASEGMNRLLADLAKRYSDRIIIFDSPPLLVTTEARALASHMGQVVLVVKAESTSHAEVKAAVAAIEACPVKMVALNMTSEGSLGGYGYGYGYGYGHNAASSEPPPPPASA
jgi:exopolysaccharide/PEP-CTERM locus tyrosine autokinase